MLSYGTDPTSKHLTGTFSVDGLFMHLNLQTQDLLQEGFGHSLHAAATEFKNYVNGRWQNIKGDIPLMPVSYLNCGSKTYGC